MNDFATVNNLFQEQLRSKLPELLAASKAAHIDEHGDFILLNVPSSCHHHSLLVFYNGDWFEISVDVPESRGPPEALVGIDKDLAEAINDTVNWLQELVTGKIVIDIERYRFFWFQPYNCASFRGESEPPDKHTVRTIRWDSSPTF